VNRKVTEIDFRKDEFKDSKVEDYEFREDGAVVRKDRWKNAIHKIKNKLFSCRGDFEIEDVISEVEKLISFRDENSDEHN